MNIRLSAAVSAAAYVALAPLPVRAQGGLVPGRSLGRVFLGMRRADVWTLLHRPTHSYTVPNAGTLYAEDDWATGAQGLTVISKANRVVQIEATSAQFRTAEGLSTASTFAAWRRLAPLSARLYMTASNVFVADSERRGVALLLALNRDPERPQLTREGLPRETPDAVIVHPPGHPALPLEDREWMTPAPPGAEADSLRLLRDYFRARR